MDYIERERTRTNAVLPFCRDAILHKGVLKLKQNEQGGIVHHKAQFIAQSYAQKESAEWKDTLAPVVVFNVDLLNVGKFTSVGWHARNSRISTAFLNGNIDQKLSLQRDNELYKRQRSLYSLMTSVYLWHEKLKIFPEGLNTYSSSGASVFSNSRWHTWSDHVGLRGGIRLFDSRTQCQVAIRIVKKPVQAYKLGEA